jgi:hypothetical protein
MWNRKRLFWVGLAVLVAGTAGCQSRVKVTRTVTLEAGQSHLFFIDAPRHDQRLTVAVSANAQVEVFVYLKRDEDAVEQAVQTDRPPPGLLASWKGDSSGTVEATVPAREAAVVRVGSTQRNATVTVNIVGK